MDDDPVSADILRASGESRFSNIEIRATALAQSIASYRRYDSPPITETILARADKFEKYLRGE